MHRVGIIPFAVKDGQIAILFVTSQTRGRWILPKGGIKKKETHAQACEREGFEEAGIKGTVLSDFPITVAITKRTPDGTQTIPVTYYPMLVTEQLGDWPEQSRRQRHWALLRDAEKVAYKEDFLGLIRQFESLSPFIKEAVSGGTTMPKAELTPAQ